MKNTTNDATGKPEVRVGKAQLRMTPNARQEISPYFATTNVNIDAVLTSLSKFHGADSPVVTTMKTALGFLQSLYAGKRIDLGDLQMIEAKQILNIYITFGHLGLASKFIKACEPRWAAEKFRVNGILLDEPGDGILTDLDLPWEDFQVFDRGHKATAILFTGVTHKFGTELNLMMQWLRPLPVNVIYVRDFNGLIYMNGLRSLGDLDTTIRKIKEKLAEMGSTRTITMGNSGGTFGALNYGHLLEAQQVICFAGPTNLEVGFQEKSDRPLYERLKLMIDEGTLTEPDIVKFYQTNNTKVRYFHGADFFFDAEQAKNIAGLPNVSIEPLPNWANHFVIGELATRGLLGNILRSAVTG